MEQGTGFLDRARAWLHDLPPPADPDVTVVIATVVGGLGLAGLANGWVEERLSKSGIFATLVGAGLFGWVWLGLGPFGFEIVPESFIEIIARILR